MNRIENKGQSNEARKACKCEAFLKNIPLVWNCQLTFYTCIKPPIHSAPSTDQMNTIFPELLLTIYYVVNPGLCPGAFDFIQQQHV